MTEQDSKLLFAESSPLTLGVELELQILDGQTLDLLPSSPSVLAAYKGHPDRLKAELFQSMIEINTGICQNAHEVNEQLGSTIQEVRGICDSLGLKLASAGTHPFAHYAGRILYPAERYRDLIDRNQWIARRLMIFGLHVHVGMRSGKHAIEMNNALLHYLPLLLAISASSPFWNGENTELASSRITFFEALPTGGHPCLVESWDEFEKLYFKMKKSQAIRSAKDIWWDIRPSPSFGTLEIRVCDGLPTLAETVSITALIHCLSSYIDSQLIEGRRFASPPDWIMRENKWRASRHGVSADLIINAEGDIRPLKDTVLDLFQELGPQVEKFGYQKQFALLRECLERGASYQRQAEVARNHSNDLKAVTQFLIDEFEAGRPIWPE